MDTAALKSLQEQIAATCELLLIEHKREQAADLEQQMQQPGFWDNQLAAQRIAQELNGLNEEVAQWDDLQQQAADLSDVAELAASEGDQDLLKELQTQLEELQQRYDELEFYVLLNGEYDASDAIVSIYAGAGGVDAQDWAQMLQRMVLRFAEQQEWRAEILDQSQGGEAGIKSATIHISGRYAYGYLQSEHGTHRLVRISPFDAEGMRHTSFANIEVVPDLGDVDADFEIDENELRIDVFRSGGNGGQSVNTTDSAVRIVHEPTGITAVCQNEKSQHQNKAAAMRILRSKLLKKHMEEREAEEAKLRGEHKSAEWGNQIRSYVLHPYKMVKDHRTDHESKHPDTVLGGELQAFAEAYLRWKAGQ